MSLTKCNACCESDTLNMNTIDRREGDGTPGMLCMRRWAGAMRGAVSVALVYLYYDPDGTTDDKQKSSLISATLTVVLFSTLVYGAITKPMPRPPPWNRRRAALPDPVLARPTTAQLCFNGAMQ